METDPISPPLSNDDFFVILGRKEKGTNPNLRGGLCHAENDNRLQGAHRGDDKSF